MPSNHYIDESQILLNMANDDIPDADHIRISVKVDKLAKYNKQHGE